VTLPAGEDPDSLLRHQGPAALRDVFARGRPLVEVIWEAEVAGRNLDTPERRAALAERLKQRVRLIADRTVQDQYHQMLVRDRLWRSFRPPKRGQVQKPQIGVGLKASGDVAGLEIRQAQVLLATLVNHPALISEEYEVIAALALPAGDLDRLRREILNVASQYPDLDSGMLKNQLKDIGLADSLAALSEPSLYKYCPFASPQAADQDARAGWRHLAALFHRRQLEEEVDAALAELSRDMTEEALARFGQLQQQFREAAHLDLDEDDPFSTGERSTSGPVPTG
jgi:DNA primase